MCKETSRETERGRQWKRGRWRVWLMWPWLLPPATRCLGQAGGRPPQRSLPALKETTRWAPFIIAHPTRPAPAWRPYPNPTCSTGDQRFPDRASARRGITSLSASSSCKSGERLSHWADHMRLWWGCEWGRVVSGGAQKPNVRLASKPNQREAEPGQVWHSDRSLRCCMLETNSADWCHGVCTAIRSHSGPRQIIYISATKTRGAESREWKMKLTWQKGE